jgi:hypothetical protein
MALLRDSCFDLHGFIGAAAERSRARERRRDPMSVPRLRPGDDYVTQVERFAGLYSELLADDGVAAAECGRQVLDAIGCARDQGGQGKPAVGVRLEVVL